MHNSPLVGDFKFGVVGAVFGVPVGGLVVFGESEVPESSLPPHDQIPILIKQINTTFFMFYFFTMIKLTGVAKFILTIYTPIN
jgi:hypothetical protein